MRFWPNICGVKVGLIYTYEAKRGPKRYGHQWLENNLLCIPMLEVALTTVVGGYGIFGVKVDFQ